MQRNSRKYFQTAQVAGFSAVIFLSTRKTNPRAELTWSWFLL